MTNMGVQVVLVVLLFIGPLKADEGGVKFWRTIVTLTCPGEGDWFNKDGKNISSSESTYEFKYENDKKGPYHCKYEDDKDYTYYFYVQGKVCENCFELDAYLFLIAIIADVTITAVVMMIIFKYTKKKSSAGLNHTPKLPARSAARSQPASSSDYEQLNQRTRSQETYSVVNRTG
uniref:CD3 epsilon n=1 Tax=Dicentrarchus labrax TaxID=13489 RepID=A0A2I4Q4M4_DICLA|nr:CD3 epsilon [Dicentrarchus labrax]